MHEIIDDLMAAKAISLLEQKRPTKANKTNDPKHFPYHMIISHPIKDCYVLKNIVDDMIRRGEIEIEGALHKGPTTSSNAASTIEQKDDYHTSSLEINEEIPMISLPPHVVTIKFIIDVDVAIVWSYPDMPSSSPKAPTSYDFYVHPTLEALATLEDDVDDDDGFG